MIAAPQGRSVRIVPMRRHHLADVAAIEAQTSARPWPVAAFLAELDRDDRRYLVALDPDASPRSEDIEVVGFAGLALQAGDAHVMTVAVHPAVRRRGIGARLVRALLSAARSAGSDAATLEVRASNEPARRLYRHAGFHDAGVRPGYYPDGEDAVIMWRHGLVSGREAGLEDATTTSRPTDQEG